MFDELNRRESEEESKLGPLKPLKNIHWKRNDARRQVAQLSDLRFRDICHDIVAEQERRYPDLKTGPTYPLQDSMPMNRPERREKVLQFSVPDGTDGSNSNRYSREDDLDAENENGPDGVSKNALQSRDSLQSRNSLTSLNSKASGGTLKLPSESRLQVQNVSQSEVLPRVAQMIESDSEEEETPPNAMKEADYDSFAADLKEQQDLQNIEEARLSRAQSSVSSDRQSSAYSDEDDYNYRNEGNEYQNNDYNEYDYNEYDDKTALHDQEDDDSYADETIRYDGISTDPVDLDKPVEPVEPVESVESVESKPVSKSVTLPEPVEPVEPMEPVEPVETVETVETVDPGNSVKSVKSVKSIESVKSSRSGNSKYEPEPVTKVSPEPVAKAATQIIESAPTLPKKKGDVSGNDVSSNVSSVGKSLSSSVDAVSAPAATVVNSAASAGTAKVAAVAAAVSAGVSAMAVVSDSAGRALAKTAASREASKAGTKESPEPALKSISKESTVEPVKEPIKKAAKDPFKNTAENSVNNTVNNTAKELSPGLKSPLNASLKAPINIASADNGHEGVSSSADVAALQARIHELEQQLELREDEDLELRSALKTQQSVTDTVRNEAAQLLQEMRSLSASHEELSAKSETLDAEVKHYKELHASVLAELERTRENLLNPGVGLPQLPAKLPTNVLDADGKIMETDLRAFFDAVSKLTNCVHSKRGKRTDTLVALHKVILPTRKIHAASNSTSLISLAANQLISVVRNFTVSQGLFPQIIVDSACADLTSAVIEQVNEFKVLANQNDDQIAGEENEYAEDELNTSQERLLMPAASADGNNSTGNSTPQAVGSMESLETRRSLQGSAQDTDTPVRREQYMPSHSGPDESVKKLQTFLEDHTSDTVEAIGGLLTGIKENSPAGELKPLVQQVRELVDRMVENTESAISDTQSRSLIEKGNFLVQSLRDYLSRLDMLYNEELQELRPDAKPNRQLKQRLAGISFDTAKCTKELVKTVEDILLREEVDVLDKRID